MAFNETHPILEILNSFHLGNLLLAFCLSMLVGLLIGALIYVLLTWMSRRRASARITRRPKKQRSGGGTPRSHNMQHRMGLYRSTGFDRCSDNSAGAGVLSLYRQPSVEPVGPLGSKPGSQASTFRPVPKGGRAAQGSSNDSQAVPPHDTTAPINSADSASTASLVPAKRNSFWLGKNGLKGFLPTQTPPPTYDSIIHAFQETCT